MELKGSNRFFFPSRIETSTCCAALLFDFLEGQVDRGDEACTQHQLRHLQLTHYCVNELGDIQTEPPVHGGLTDTGVQVRRRCNALGIVVDVAHGTYDLVKRAADTSTRRPRSLIEASAPPPKAVKVQTTTSNRRRPV